MSQISAAAVQSAQKTYVFVDEYNRHKRLKVMRACDGCRKRKIRCDGALQNGPWPCGACIRLRLRCAPPTLDGEDDPTSPDDMNGWSQFAMPTPTSTGSHRSTHSPAQADAIPTWTTPIKAEIAPGSTALASAPMLSQNVSIPSDAYQVHQYGQRNGYTSQTQATNGYVHHTHSDLHRLRSGESAASSNAPSDVESAVKQLSEHMGDLSIDPTSVATYITKEKTALAEVPAIEEIDIVLPPSVSADSTVRIPAEMMPSEERALDYFGYYFDYIHPYIPVLHRREFYDQWRTARNTISPLILEGMFACVAKYLDEEIEVRRWLALASRHEESFKDVPRLSTIQAMVILTKAREAVPKRGYYYRSWMAVKYMTTMAIDLGLPEHYHPKHEASTCELGPLDCMLRTRIWQTLFILEIMVGGPQGRTDFSIESETVDLRIPERLDSDEFEYQTSRRNTYFTQTICNIKRTNTLWQSMRRLKADWALDPDFVRQNDSIDGWPENLPQDMRVGYGDDNRSVNLAGDHYVAYLHTYHHLVVIMQHRPQLQILLQKGDPGFKDHLEICSSSAMIICRLQEALFREYGLHGLQFMQRGIGFTIYCILTCTMLHLAAITCPDPVANTRGRMYFTRHMRILEHCTPNASAEMQIQINTLRQAFSQDTSQPFELKHGLGVSTAPLQPLPMATPQTSSKGFDRNVETWPRTREAILGKTAYNSHPPNSAFRTPPAQPGLEFDPFTEVARTQHAYPLSELYQVSSAPQLSYGFEPTASNGHVTPTWDPSIIFNQWNTAFGQPPAATPSTVAISAEAAFAPPPQMVPPATQRHIPVQPLPGQQLIHIPQQPATRVGPTVADSASDMPTVTPVMWQDAFTTAYVSGQGNKRYRNDGFDFHQHDQYQKRRG